MTVFDLAISVFNDWGRLVDDKEAVVMRLTRTKSHNNQSMPWKEK
jgi:hypothetical protein